MKEGAWVRKNCSGTCLRKELHVANPCNSMNIRTIFGMLLCC